MHTDTPALDYLKTAGALGTLAGAVGGGVLGGALGGMHSISSAQDQIDNMGLLDQLALQNHPQGAENLLLTHAAEEMPIGIGAGVLAGGAMGHMATRAPAQPSVHFAPYPRQA